MQIIVLGLQGATNIDLVTAATARMTTTDLAAALAKTGLSKAQQRQILMDRGLTKEEAKAAVATATHAAATATATTATGFLSSALATAKVAVKGLTAALASNPFILIATVVAGLVVGLNALVEAEGKAAEKAKEIAEASAQAAKTQKDETDKVSELIEKYKELAQSDTQDIETREEIKSIQEEITKLVGTQADNLDLVNGKLDEELAKLYEIQNIELGKTVSSYEKAYVDAAGATSKYDMHDANWVEDLSLWMLGDKDTLTIDYWGDNKNRDKALKLIDEAWKEKGYGKAYTGEVTYDLLGLFWDTYAELEFNSELNSEERVAALDAAIKALEDADDFDYSNNELWKRLVEIRDDWAGENGLFTAQAEAARELLDALITQEIGSGEKVNSLQEYLDYKQKIIDAVSDNDVIKQAIEDGAISQDSIDTYVNNHFGTLDKYDEWYDRLKKVNTLKEKFQKSSWFADASWSIAEPRLNDFNEWLNSLTDEELAIVYDVVANTDTADFTLQDWKDAVEGNATVEVEVVVSEEEKAISNFKSALQKYKDSVVSKYGNVDFSEIGKYDSYKTTFDIYGVPVETDIPRYGYAASGEYDGIKIAYSPYLATDDGLVYLESDTVSNYIDKLMDKAGDDWTYDELMRLDSSGLEVDGVHIQNIIADIGDSAEETKNKINDMWVAEEGLNSARIVLYRTLASSYKETLTSLWESEDFKETKKSLITMAKSAEGITADTIKELAEESEVLAEMLEKDGINAEYLANILEHEALGGNGFELITEGALKLNTALEGMTRRFDEVTEAKARYDAALSAGEKDDNFKSYAEAFEALNNEFKEGTVNSNQFWAAAEFIFGADQLQEWGWSDGIDQIYAAMQKNVGVFEDAESAGAGFLDQLYKIAEGGQVIGEDGSVIAEIEKFADGSYEFNVDALYLDELAEKMGLSKEAVLACLEALSMWGDVDYYDMDEVLTAIKDIGLSSDDFDGTAVNVSALTDQLLTLGYTNKEIYELLDSLQEIEGIELLNVDSDVATLTESLQNLGIATGEVGEVKINADGLLNLMQSLQYTKEDAQELINKLGEADGITLTNSTGEVKNVDDVLADIETRTFATVESELSTVSSEINDANDAADVLYQKLQMIDGTTVTVSVRLDVKSSILKSLGLEGFAKGTDNAPNGAALVGEEGEELIKSGDRAYLAGTHGAEIVHLNEGDTVYTAEETKRIKRSARGIHGTLPAYSGGYTGGTGGRINTGKTYEDLLPDSGDKSSNNKSSSSDDDKIDTFDWIEVAIDRIERVIDRLKKTAESTYKSLKSKLGAAADEISMVNQEIAMQQQAFNRYMQEANSVGLSSDLKEKVRTGTIDINEYDEDTQNLIKDYQDWYEKALDCSDAIDDLHESLASLYEDNFNNVKDDFENQLTLAEHLTNQYETGIDMLEARGYLESTKYYAALQDATKGEIAIMNKELAGLEQAFSDAMNSGEIEKYSEAW